MKHIFVIFLFLLISTSINFSSLPTKHQRKDLAKVRSRQTDSGLFGDFFFPEFFSPEKEEEREESLLEAIKLVIEQQAFTYGESSASVNFPEGSTFRIVNRNSGRAITRNTNGTISTAELDDTNVNQLWQVSYLARKPNNDVFGDKRGFLIQSADDPSQVLSRSLQTENGIRPQKFGTGNSGNNQSNDIWNRRREGSINVEQNDKLAIAERNQEPRLRISRFPVTNTSAQNQFQWDIVVADSGTNPIPQELSNLLIEWDRLFSDILRLRFFIADKQFEFVLTVRTRENDSIKNEIEENRQILSEREAELRINEQVLFQRLNELNEGEVFLKFKRQEEQKKDREIENLFNEKLAEQARRLKEYFEVMKRNL